MSAQGERSALVGGDEDPRSVQVVSVGSRRLVREGMLYNSSDMKRCPGCGKLVAAVLASCGLCGGHHAPGISAEMLKAMSELPSLKVLMDEPVYYSGVSVHPLCPEMEQPEPEMPSNDVTVTVNGLRMTSHLGSISATAV